MSIILYPLLQTRGSNKSTKVWIRKRKPSNMQTFCRFLLNQDWSVLSRLPSCQAMCDLFYDIILMALDLIIPPTAVSLHCKDKAWITPEIKSLISQRQRALTLGDKSEYNKLKKKTIRAIKQAKSKFYESLVTNLKNSNPQKWWNSIKNLNGSSSKPVFNSVETEGTI